MKRILQFASLSAMLVSFGCASSDSRSSAPQCSEPTVRASDCDDDDDDDHYEEDDRPQVWRFPFVQIAIDPWNPSGVAVRVADDINGREYVDLGVSWDD
jgi:hypothetical protein